MTVKKLKEILSNIKDSDDLEIYCKDEYSNEYSLSEVYVKYKDNERAIILEV